MSPLEPPTFSTVRFREGYSIEEVDEFLAQAKAALEFDPPLMGPEEAETQRFTPVRVHTGYDMEEVDDYLDRLADELRRRQGPEPSAAEMEPVVVPKQPSSAPWLMLIAVVSVIFVGAVLGFFLLI